MPFTNPKTHSMGGKAVDAALTPEQRKSKAQAAIKARWDRVRAERKKAA